MIFDPTEFWHWFFLIGAFKYILILGDMPALFRATNQSISQGIHEQLTGQESSPMKYSWEVGVWATIIAVAGAFTIITWPYTLLKQGLNFFIFNTDVYYFNQILLQADKKLNSGTKPEEGE